MTIKRTITYQYTTLSFTFKAITGSLNLVSNTILILTKRQSNKLCFFMQAKEQEYYSKYFLVKDHSPFNVNCFNSEFYLLKTSF